MEIRIKNAARTNSATNDSLVAIHALHDIGEMDRCVALQEEVWGFSQRDLVPASIFLLAAKTGGQVFGAFDGEKIVGFALALAALRDGNVFLHSHMVAVLAGYQSKGLGQRLKLAQRDDAIARGIKLMEWTFDPLQVKNAHFNLLRLGAVVRRYEPNLYGETSSPLHLGLATDRLVAEWWLGSPHVQQALDRHPYLPALDCERISVALDIAAMCREEPRKGHGIQAEVRVRFEDLLTRGYVVVGFELGKEFGTYLLEIHEN